MAAHARLRAAGLGQGRRRVPRAPDQHDATDAGTHQRARRPIAQELEMTDLMQPDAVRDEDEVVIARRMSTARHAHQAAKRRSTPPPRPCETRAPPIATRYSKRSASCDTPRRPTI